MHLMIARRVLAACLVFTLLLVPAGGPRAASAAPPEPLATAEGAGRALPAGGAARGLLILGVPLGADGALPHRLAARHGAKVERWLPQLGVALVSVPPGQEQAAAVSLRKEREVSFAGEHRQLATVADIPLDPYWNMQWNMVKVEGPAAWDVAWSVPSVPIAVIDTGVNYLQRDLVARAWYNPGESGVDPATGSRSCDAAIAHNGLDDDGNGYVDDCRGYDFVDKDSDPMDEHADGHGTFVAGIAVASTDNSDPTHPDQYEGVAGMARNASLMPLRVLGTTGLGYTVDIAEAIVYAGAAGARVINLSLTFGPTTPDDSADMQLLGRAINSAQAAGALVVGAAGNQSYNGVDFPAKFPGVLAVGASTQTDQRASFSNYGSRLDIIAPGVGIYSTLIGPGTAAYGYLRGASAYSSGTSFAAPLAAGVAALIRGLRPDLPQDAVYELMRQTADDVAPAGFDPQTGWGRLNAVRAVRQSVVGLAVRVEVGSPAVAASKETPVQVHITAPGDVPAGAGARVMLTATGGTIIPAIMTLGADGSGHAVFTAGSMPGPAEIGVQFADLSATAAVSVTEPLNRLTYLPWVTH